MSSRVRRLGATAACLVAVASVVGCEPRGADPASGAPSASAVAIPSVSSGETALPLPPFAEAEIAAVFDPLLVEYGLRVSRAALLDTTASYEESETGRFLGLYVEPIGEYDEADYIENLVPVARLMITLSFERWPGLEDVDVCQEPPTEVDDSETPPPETQLQVSHEAADALDWERLDLARLIFAAREQDPRGIILRVSQRLSDEPLWTDAQEAAEALGN